MLRVSVFVGMLGAYICYGSDLPCYTPEGRPGVCVTVNACPHLLELSHMKPAVKEATNYILNSKCKGGEESSVCCGDPLDTVVSPESCAATLTAAPPPPDTECCGRDQTTGNKIYGGNDTAIDEYPWLVLLEYVAKKLVTTDCGGSLISNRYVLTAAHCVAPPTYYSGLHKLNVRLGEYDITTEGKDCVKVEAHGEDCTDGAITVAVDDIIIHDKYNESGSGHNDIALLRLATPAPYTDFIRPICLPSKEWPASPPDEFPLYAAGWGAVAELQPHSRVKQHVQLPYVDRKKCEGPYRRKFVRGQICAGGVSGEDTCNGDSGGPLMYQHGNTFEVIGVTSFGPNKCGSKGLPGVYTNVWEYDAWIRNNIKP